VTKNGDSKPYCTVCCAYLPSDTQKAIKQHLKSKPHKDAQKQPVQILEAGSDEDHVGETIEKLLNNDPESSEEEEKCELCRMNGRTQTRHSPESYARALERGEEVEPCFPPPFIRSPKALFPRCRKPFLSLERCVIHGPRYDLLR
jgi:hypothetical protein